MAATAAAAKSALCGRQFVPDSRALSRCSGCARDTRSPDAKVTFRKTPTPAHRQILCPTHTHAPSPLRLPCGYPQLAFQPLHLASQPRAVCLQSASLLARPFQQTLKHVRLHTAALLPRGLRPHRAVPARVRRPLCCPLLVGVRTRQPRAWGLLAQATVPRGRRRCSGAQGKFLDGGPADKRARPLLHSLQPVLEAVCAVPLGACGPFRLLRLPLPAQSSFLRLCARGFGGASSLCRCPALSLRRLHRRFCVSQRLWEAPGRGRVSGERASPPPMAHKQPRTQRYTQRQQASRATHSLQHLNALPGQRCSPLCLRRRLARGHHGSGRFPARLRL